MRQLTTLTISIILLAVAGQAAAQFRDDVVVYEKKDPDGVPSYSAIPSEGARPVIIPPANPADSVEVRPPATPDAEPLQAARQPGTPEYEQNVQRQLEDYRQTRQESRRERDSETRRKVGTGADTQRRTGGDNDGSR